MYLEKKMSDSFGDRIKKYELQESGRRFIPLLPVCARLDGKNFSNFTKGLCRPYDEIFSRLMIDTTKYLVEETCACIGYTQSDEISLVYYSDKADSQIFFDGRIQKIVSVLASMCTIKFNQLLQNTYVTVLEKLKNYLDGDNIPHYLTIWNEKRKLLPVFDCRAWIVPTQIEACNTLLWREIDATKNSISMAASEYYSDKQLFEKNSSEKQEMLFQKGVNWDQYPSHFKRGTYIQRRKNISLFTTEEIKKLPPKHEARTNPNLMIERTEVRELEMPPLNRVINKIGVIFNGEEPKEENQMEKIKIIK